MDRRIIAEPHLQTVTRSSGNDAYNWTLPATSRTYRVNGLNQYVEVGPNSYTYDSNGNLTSDGITGFVYDAENRLVSATGPGNHVTLSYDPLGRLWQAWGFTGKTQFVYDGDSTSRGGRLRHSRRAAASAWRRAAGRAIIGAAIFPVTRKPGMPAERQCGDRRGGEARTKVAEGEPGSSGPAPGSARRPALSFAPLPGSLADPAGASVLAAAVQWLQGTLLGTAATSVAVICVAAVGLTMLSGRIDLRRAMTVIAGCFILFGAAAIAAGIQAVAGLAGTAPAAAGPDVSPSPLAALPPPPQPARPVADADPLAGATVPYR